MQLRRVLLILLVVMATSAFAASLVRTLSAQQERAAGTTTTEQSETGPTTPQAESTTEAERKAPAFAADDAELLELRAGDEKEAVFGPGTHLIVSVTSKEPGQAFIVGLGEVLPVTPGTPAIFDLLLERDGEFPVRVRPVDGAEDLPVGLIRVEEDEEGVRDRGGRPRA